MGDVLTFGSALFVLAAACYLLFITSDPLERVGGRIGRLLRVPEDVIASTFQALATSGPEIVMAILAATPFVASGVWKGLQIGERACSGCLNMCFSAMDNLLGIGCVGIIFMIIRGTVKKDQKIIVQPSVKIGLVFYILASTCLCLFVSSKEPLTQPKIYNAGARDPDKKFQVEFTHRVVTVPKEDLMYEEQLQYCAEDQNPDDLPPDIPVGAIDVGGIGTTEAWVLACVGIAFIISQFFVPPWIRKRQLNNDTAEPDDDGDDEDDDDEDEKPLPKTLTGWFKDLLGHGFIYAFLVFALVIFVRECLGATFNMALVGVFSVGGILIMFTSYVSSFPEFMMTYRYAMSNKKSALLGMLFGSNVIDLAFAGFRSMWLHEPMAVYTTGRWASLMPVYLWALPTIAVISLFGLWTKRVKYGYAYPLVVFYLFYIISGWVLL